MNLRTIEGWETPHTTTHDNTFYSSENEPRRVYWNFSPDETFDSNERRRVSPAENHTAAFTATEEKNEHWEVFSSKGGSVAAHLRDMRPNSSRKKDTLLLRENTNSNTTTQTPN